MVKGYKISIVEDNENYAEQLTLMINSCNEFLFIQHYESAEDCIGDIEKNTVDVLIVDIGLPGMNGVDLIPYIKKIDNNILIIMLTMFDDDYYIFNALCFGANGYLLKSSDMENFEDTIISIINGGTVMNPFIASKALKLFTKYKQAKQEYGLTKQEKKILELLIEGYNKKRVADKLYISFFTVDKHLQNIYQKLNVHSQIDLVAKALRENLI